MASPRYRRGARFVDARHHCRPLDRNQRARILCLAEALERRTKPAGGRNGVLGYVGLQVLRALLLTFHNAKSGLCDPSYITLRAATGLCSQSVRNGLRRLERAGIVRIVRRLVREAVDAGGYAVTVCRQGSNLYSFAEPAGYADHLPVRQPTVRPFPKRKLGLEVFFNLPDSIRQRLTTQNQKLRGESSVMRTPSAIGLPVEVEPRP